MIFDHPHLQKHRPCQCFWGFLHLFHDRSWDRSWTDFGSILEPKIDPKSVPKRLENVSNFIVDFESHPGPPKINFWANMAPTWRPLGFKNDPKWSPNWCPNRSQNGSGEPKMAPRPSRVEFKSIFFDFDWFFDDFSLEQIWTNLTFDVVNVMSFDLTDLQTRSQIRIRTRIRIRIRIRIITRIIIRMRIRIRIRLRFSGLEFGWGFGFRFGAGLGLDFGLDSDEDSN